MQTAQVIVILLLEQIVPLMEVWPVMAMDNVKDGVDMVVEIVHLEQAPRVDILVVLEVRQITLVYFLIVIIILEVALLEVVQRQIRIIHGL
jgi:hypothetical protein